MNRSDLIYMLVIMGLIIAGATYCGNTLAEVSQNKWDIIIERCHDGDGRDYDGCLKRENLEWNRGGKSGAF